MRNLFVMAAVFVALSVSIANAATDKMQSTNGDWTAQYYDEVYDQYLESNNSGMFKNIIYGDIDPTSSPKTRVYNDIPNTWYRDESDGSHSWIGVYNGLSSDWENNENYKGDESDIWNLAGYYSLLSDKIAIDGANGAIDVEFWNDNALLGVALFKDGVKEPIQSWDVWDGVDDWDDENNVGLNIGRNVYDNYKESAHLRITGLGEGDYYLMFVLANGFPNDHAGGDGWGANIPFGDRVAVGPMGLMAEIGVKSGGENITPEPATLAMIGLGMFGAGFVARRRNKK